MARPQLRSPRSILITGASSGIGAALARRYAAPKVALALSGRDAARLAEVAAACRQAGARVAEHQVDVTDRAAMAAWITEIDQHAPLDLVIANAGTAASGLPAGPARTRAIFAVNLEGVLNTIEPALTVMLARGCGQLALMSSLAGLRPMPGSPAYAASKAAVRFLGEGLRARHAGDGIRISVICPGFVATPMTVHNPFPMPLLLSAERAARIIERGLARGAARIAFPRRTHWAVRLLAALPSGPIDRLLARLPSKE